MAEHPNRNVVDRRLGLERRVADDPNYDGPERRVASNQRRTGLERRRGAGIRRDEDRRSAEEGEMTPGQYEFIRAIETYKKVNKKLFPTWTEVLEVIDQLGYRKVEPRTIDLPGVPDPLAADGTRPADAPPVGELADPELPPTTSKPRNSAAA
jgi:hypothetical protein